MAEMRFTGSFTQQEPIPEEGISAALELLRTGRLHRYNTVQGETSLTAPLEVAYTEWQGAKYRLALASGGQAMQIALRACGAPLGDKVLSNAFTLAPGAIAVVGAETVLVKITEDLMIDLDDLAAKARASGARHLLLSDMRGHLCDMDRLMQVAEDCGLNVIEDCAHTMGAKWNGRRSGNFGAMGCFSTQTYEHMNSGEGGLLTTDDPKLMASAIIMSGSYMLFERHGAAPAREVFEAIRLETRNMSARMDNLHAAILLPQLERLDDAITRWNALHDRMAERLASLPRTDAVLSTLFDMRLPLTFKLTECDAIAQHLDATLAGLRSPEGAAWH